MRIKSAFFVSACVLLVCAFPSMAQQKGQWVPGQFGLNSRSRSLVSGVTYANLALNYSASQLNDSNGNPILQNVTGTYSFWVDENIVYYVSHHKFLGGYFMPYVADQLSQAVGGGGIPPLIPGTNRISWRRRRVRIRRHVRRAGEYWLAFWQTS